MMRVPYAMGWVLPDRLGVGVRPSGPSPEILFRRLFRRTFLTLFSRLCGLGLVSLVFLLLFLIISEELLERLVLLGQLNVRRMSGNWIASVCRLCARAPNYRPTILLSCFTSICSLTRPGACVAYLNRRNCCELL